MNWENEALRAAALRLLLTHRVLRAKSSTVLLIELEELGFVGPTLRTQEYKLHIGKEDAFRDYLLMRWPQFPLAEAAFRCRPHAVSAIALREHRRALRALPPHVTQLNRKTWSAWAGAHSKSGRRTPPAGITLTADGTLRLRPSAGLGFVTGGGARLPLDEWGRALGEVSIPERALAGAWRLAGAMPRMVLTVENIGAFVDFQAPPWLLIAHAPGWDTRLATRFLGGLPPDLLWLHFADIDPNGLRIGLSLRRPGSDRRPRPWIPRAAQILLSTHALPLKQAWPVETLPAELRADPLLSELIATQRWLEHEPLVLLPELVEELQVLTG
jgi:hypothetical protein